MYESSERENSPWITLDLEGWAPLTEGRAPVQYRKKAILFHQEDAADAVFIVKSGRLRITSYNIVTVIGTAASRVYFHLKAEAVRMRE